MASLIDALEQIGQDSQLRHADRTHLDRELAAMGIDDHGRAAMLDGDSTQLEELLGASAKMCCLVEVPIDEPASS